MKTCILPTLLLVAAACHGQTSINRLIPSELRYLGAFLLPATDFFADTGAGGFPQTAGLAFRPDGQTGAGTLFVAVRGGCAEITTPTPAMSNLLTAAVLQSTPSMAVGNVGAWGDNDAVSGVAYLPPRGDQAEAKLYFGSFEYYNVDATDYASVGWCSTTLADPQAAGLWHVGPRTTDEDSPWHGQKYGEYLIPVPQDWANTHTQGRSLLAGRMREAGAAGGSMGPVLTAIAPWQHGNPPPAGANLDATPLAWFPTAGGNAGENTSWQNWRLHGDPDWMYFSPCDRVTGGAWIERAGRRTLVLALRHGTFSNDPPQPQYGSAGSHGGFVDDPTTPPSCYGEGGVDCAFGIAVTGYQGYHCGPYRARLVLIDIADLEAVAAGTRDAGTVTAYGVVDLMAAFGRPAGTVQDRTGSHDVFGVTYDEVRGRLYVGQSNGLDPDGHPFSAWPVIHVYQVEPALPPVKIESLRRVSDEVLLGFESWVGWHYDIESQRGVSGWLAVRRNIRGDGSMIEVEAPRDGDSSLYRLNAKDVASP